MAVQEHVAELCEAVFSELERVIVHHFPLNSLSLEIKEDLVDGAKNLLEVSVLLEALFSEGEAVTERIQKIVTCLEAVYKEELGSVGGWSLSCIIVVFLLKHQGGHDYGMDWDEPITVDEDNTVTVPDLPLYVLSEQRKHILREELTLHHDDTYGVEHYVLTRHFIFRCHSP